MVRNASWNQLSHKLMPTKLYCWLGRCDSTATTTASASGNVVSSAATMAVSTRVIITSSQNVMTDFVRRGM
jgi:hypothetical protein